MFSAIRDIKIAAKLTTTMVLLAFASTAIASLVSFTTSSESLLAAASEKLAALEATKKDDLERYLESIRQDLRTMSSNPTALTALEAFSEAWRQLPAPTAYLQKAYIDDNPHPTGQKENLDDAEDGSRYSAVHAEYHPWLRTFLRERGYYDIFLFDTDGNLVYTVFKELDYATNVNTGKWRETDLGNAFRAARDAAKRDSHQFFDFKPYAPSHGAAASFISSSILDADGRLRGVLVFQMPIDRLNKVMQTAAGMGESGETYIVGGDRLMRSDSRFAQESTILKVEVDTETVRRALDGESGVMVTPDYRGIPVLSAYGALEFLGTTWAIMAEIDEAEVLAPVNHLLIYLVAVATAIVVVIGCIGAWFARSMTRPINAVTDAMTRLAEGDTQFDVPPAERADEIGAMTTALISLQETSVRAVRSQSALGAASANFMIADADYNIVYMNKAAQELFESREAELRQDLPNLDARNLIGSNIDDFHKNPTHQRGILAGLSNPHVSRLKIGGVTFDLVVTPAFNDKGERIATSVQWTDITDKLAAEEEMARAKSTLDAASANFMIADADYNIVYVNKALVELFRGREGDIRRELPAFDLNNLIGTNIDVFHKNPSHQRNLLNGLRAPHNGRVEVAGLTFDLIVTPVFGPNGERVGTSVQWTDVTAQLAVEDEVADLVQAAGAGDFSRRLAEDGKQGFMLELAKGMNELVGTVDRGLNETVSVMSAMAQGDLTRRIEGDYRGTFLKLKDDSNQMAEKIGGIAKRIVGATGTVSDATSEIASGAGDLSSRTEQQASSLEETAASMEELSATVRQNADNAQQANQLAVAARDAASNGGQVVASAVDAMSKIESSSKQITEIMGMIDEIAFQTNLLALNAAVEAARAGEAGKGFAVVATEVRALAQRSGKASKEIKELISNSDSQVRDGVGLVQKAGASLEEIVTSVKKVADIISDIAAASKEQASGIDEVGTAVSNMDEMTQQNAALVEETTAALHSMTGQIDDLKTLVRFFKTGEKEEELEPDTAPDPGSDGNPVHQQQQTLAKNVAAVGGGGGAAAAAVAEQADDEWEEF